VKSLNDEPGSLTTSPGVPVRRRRPTFGILLIILGLLLLAHQVIPEIATMLFWPILLISAGIWVLWRARRT
jgi:uncharacterized membrane protein HdeD (DUF308 family)